MDWNSLQDFLSIARHRSLAGAARARHVNHSTIFRRLNSLEEMLGARLFERLPDGYQLTLEGERLLPHAERIEAEAIAAERAVADADAAPRGNIRLTAPGNLAYSYLPGYLEQFHRLYPNICVELIVTNQDLNLARREADIALRATRQPPDYLVGRCIFEIGWGIYAAGELAKKVSLGSTHELAQWPIIGAESALWYLAAFRWIEDQMPAGSIVMRGSDLMSIAALASRGLGLAVLPDDHNAPPLKRLADFPPGLVGGFWLLTHPDLRHTGRIKLLMDHLVHCFRVDQRFQGLVTWTGKAS